MSVEAIETAIIERLRPVFPAAVVDAFPDKFDDYDRLPLNRGACILVAYKGSQFEAPRPLGLVVQEQRPEFEIQVISKSLRGHQGALALLDGVRLSLTGYRPASADPLYPIAEHYVPAPAGTWVYAMTFATSLPHVEAQDEDQGEAPFTDATNIDTTTGPTWQYNLATDASTEVTP